MKGFSMHTLDDRLAALEGENRRLKRWLLGLTLATSCGVLMAAGGSGRDAAFNNLLVKQKLVVGGADRPAVVIESKKDLTGVVIADKENQKMASLLFSPSGQVALLLNDRNGDQVFEASYREAGLGGKPITMVTLKQPVDKAELMLSSAPAGRVGVVVLDENGNVRSQLDRNGAKTK
jgi:hypothetical protein